jgi:prepilin-type N-terminal cleavage/methylation domain-containing protein
MVRPSSQSGYSLIETMVASVIILGAMVATFQLKATLDKATAANDLEYFARGFLEAKSREHSATGADYPPLSLPHGFSGSSSVTWTNHSRANLTLGISSSTLVYTSPRSGSSHSLEVVRVVFE